MTEASSIVYLGWSGISVKTAAGSMVFIDPPAGTEFPGEGTATVLLTHGHPDHVSGTLAWLTDQMTASRLTVIGSARLVRHLEDQTRPGRARFVGLTAGEQLSMEDGSSVSAIDWTHMGHTPPELKNALKHFSGFLFHPVRSIGIALEALEGPPWSPMIGFLIANGDERLLFYGEGIHRKANLSEIRTNIQALSPTTTLFAVEPEDTEALPEILARTGIANVFIYEAHREWRHDLGLGTVNLQSVAASLRAGGVEVALP